MEKRGTSSIGDGRQGIGFQLNNFRVEFRDGSRGESARDKKQIDVKPGSIVAEERSLVTPN